MANGAPQWVIDGFQRPLTRRLITIPGVVAGAITAVLTAPFTGLAALIADRGRLGRRVRLVALSIGALSIELAGIVVSTMLWVVTGFGRFGSSSWSQRRHAQLMGWYTSTALGLAAWALDTTIEWRTEPIDRPTVVLARHTSYFDALIPATLLCRRNGLIAHHVIIAGLRYSPCIDLVGRRVPTRFITRQPAAGSRELAEIEALGRLVDTAHAAVIFPEGGFRTPARFERSIERLAQRSPELAERASGLEHVLPPRVNGTWALLQGAGDADLVICANTGFEEVATVGQMRSLGADRPIVIETWRIDRDLVPTDLDEFRPWLLDQFARMDRWVANEIAVATADAREDDPSI